MSECNYCSLRRIRRQALRDGKKVIERRGWKKGIDVFVLPRDARLPSNVSQRLRDKFFVAWFWKLTEHCVC